MSDQPSEQATAIPGQDGLPGPIAVLALADEVSPRGAAASRLAADGKDADAFRTIGEVAQALSIRPHVLRYWEEQFPMLRPVKRSGGRRYYRPEDIALIETIVRLVHHEGFTLRGARQHLDAMAPAARASRRGGRIGQLREIRDELAHALD